MRTRLSLRLVMLKIQHAFEIKNKLHWFLLILLISPRLNPSIIFAQHYFYCNYQTFGEKDGYQCFSTPGLITEDKNGLIWIGGDNGLYCFDGTHFKNYRHSKSDTNSLPFNLANFNYQDNHGNYWVYVVNNGLFNFYPRYGNFIKFALPGVVEVITTPPGLLLLLKILQTILSGSVAMMDLYIFFQTQETTQCIAILVFIR